MGTVLSVRLNDEERAVLTEMALTARSGLSTYARKVIREHLGLEPQSGRIEALELSLESLNDRLATIEEMARRERP